jgi:hypothetical protein
MVRKRRTRKYLRIWPERYTPKHLRADDILRIMHTPVDLSWYQQRGSLSVDEQNAVVFDWRRHWWPRKKKIGREATVKEIIVALDGAASPKDRAILLEILGDHAYLRTIPLMLPYISDRSYRVRFEAGEAVGKIALRACRMHGDKAFSDADMGAIGEVLLKRYTRERSQKWRNGWLVSALGAVGYRPAIPYLIDALKESDSWLRGAAAWSLGILRDMRAIEPLGQAYAVETDGYAKERMRVALIEIRTGVSEWQMRRNQRERRQSSS